MEAHEHEELRTLKEYNKYLNKEGLARLVYLWNKKGEEEATAKKNGM